MSKRSPTKWVSLGLVAIIAASLLLSIRYPWLRSTAITDRFFARFGRAMGITAAILLGAYLLHILLSLRRCRQPDGDVTGMGCLSVVAIVVAALLLVLLIGLIFHVNALIKLVSAVTIAPAAVLAMDLAYKKLTSRRNRDG